MPNRVKVALPHSDPLPQRPEGNGIDDALFRDFCTNEAVRVRRFACRLIEQGKRQSGHDLIDIADALALLAGEGLRPQ